MALFGSPDALPAQLRNEERFRAAFALLNEASRPESTVHRLLMGLSPGQTERIELPDGAIALPQAYLSRSRSEGRWEHHRKFVDVQAVFEGREDIEVADAAGLRVEEDQTPANDFVFLEAPERATVFRLEPGQVAVLFPSDAHLGGVAVGAPALVRKICVKVPLA